MIKYIFCLLLLSALFACGSFNLFNGENPKKESFQYYNKDFKMSAVSILKIERKYYYQKSDSQAYVLVFFNDGFLNSYFTIGPNTVSTNRAESGVPMGYYETRGDSIFFTTKSYYQHKPTYYEGVVTDQNMVLKVKYPTNKEPVIEKYSLY